MRGAWVMMATVLLTLAACGDDGGVSSDDSTAGANGSSAAASLAARCDGFDTVERQREILAEEEDLEAVAEALRRMVGGLRLIMENGEPAEAAAAEEVLHPIGALSALVDAEDLRDPAAFERIQATPEFAAYRAGRVRDGLSALIDLHPDCEAVD